VLPCQVPRRRVKRASLLPAEFASQGDATTGLALNDCDYETSRMMRTRRTRYNVRLDENEDE
jgi:hypothetical protein